MNGEQVIRQYVIYEHPADYPEGYVVREWEITAGEVQIGPAQPAATLEEARSLIPPGATQIEVGPQEDKTIIEIWALPAE